MSLPNQPSPVLLCHDTSSALTNGTFSCLQLHTHFLCVPQAHISMLWMMFPTPLRGWYVCDHVMWYNLVSTVLCHAYEVIKLSTYKIEMLSLYLSLNQYYCIQLAASCHYSHIFYVYSCFICN